MNKVNNRGFSHRLNSKILQIPFRRGSNGDLISTLDINDNDVGNFYNLSIKFNKTTGYGFFSGNVDINGTPASMKVKLYLAGTKILVQETESLSHNGYFEFNNIADDAVYDMYAIPKDGMYETKVKENITCLANYKRMINFNIVGVSKAPPNNSRPIRFTMIALNTINTPSYEIKNAPSWLDVDSKTGLCSGKPNRYIQSLVVICVVYDGDKSYEFTRTVNFDDTRFVVEYNNNVKDSFNTSTIVKDIEEKTFIDFPKGGKALYLGDDYIQYEMVDNSFSDIKSGSYTLEITCNIKTLKPHGIIFSSDKIGKSRFVVGHKLDKLYFNINGETVFVNNIFSQVSIEANTWFVLTICKTGSTYYGFYNGVLIHQWSSAEFNIISNNFYVGDNKQETGTETDIFIRKIRFIKNISDYDDTYETEYSFVDEAIAFPRYLFKHIESTAKPNNYIDAVYNGSTVGTENARVFKNNGAYFASAYYGNTTPPVADRHFVTLPTYNETIDLGTTNWTVYTDIMLTKDAVSYYSSYVMMLISNLTNQSLFSIYLNDGLYGGSVRRLSPIMNIGSTGINFGYDNKSTRKISFLKRHYVCVSRKKNYLYLFLDGVLVNKISISATKTFSFLGKGNLIGIGHNASYSNTGYYYTATSSQGVILRKNLSVTESFDIYESLVTRYSSIRFGYESIIPDEYFTDKIEIDGTISNNNRYCVNLSTSKVLINDVYNMNDVLTVRLTGTTISSSIKQNLLTLKNTQSGEYYNFYTDINGIGFKASTGALNAVINTNIKKGDNAPFDIVLSSDGSIIRIQVDGVNIAYYDISNGSTLFDVCYIGTDETGTIKSNSSSSVALFQQSLDVYFTDDLIKLDKTEYHKEVDFKLLYQNVPNYNVVSITNLYTNAVTTKTTYSHRMIEVRNGIKPFGDWTLEMCVTPTATYSSANQWLYSSYYDNDTSQCNLCFWFDTLNRLCIQYSSLPSRTNLNGTIYNYTSTEQYKTVGEKMHIAVVRTGTYVKIFVNGVMVRSTEIPDFTPFFDYSAQNYYPSLYYNNSSHYARYSFQYFRILNGIALYQDSFDPTNALNNIPSEGITSFPTTTSLPSRFKMTKP